MFLVVALHEPLTFRPVIVAVDVTVNLDYAIEVVEIVKLPVRSCQGW